MEGLERPMRGMERGGACDADGETRVASLGRAVVVGDRFVTGVAGVLC